MVHVNRTLKKLRDENTRIFRRGIVEILNMAALGKHGARLQDIFERENPDLGGELPKLTKAAEDADLPPCPS